MNVIGTAGHVDHGKTRLIEALTGINADRLPEEQERGMTIDLGFAHFPDGHGQPIGVVDVPGHERFIRNMVAGAWGLDCALLTVAADDGWMQQSNDHTRVLKLMAVPRLIVVVTKSDSVSPQRAEEVCGQAIQHCRKLGYPDCPASIVSAQTGENMAALKTLILDQLTSDANHQAADIQRSPFMYVDRVFTIQGSGTVVTGTLRGGSISTGQEMTLLPYNADVRIRGLQSYFDEIQSAEPVSRVAVNLQGLGQTTPKRGDCLVPRTAGESNTRLHAEREMLIRLQTDDEEIKNHSEIEIALGTGHSLCQIHRLDDQIARIICPQPMPMSWNQPVVLIRHGGSAILGGGRIVWLGSLNRQNRLQLLPHLKKLPNNLESMHQQTLELQLNGYIRSTPGSVPEPGQIKAGAWLFRQENFQMLRKEILELAAKPGGISLPELRSKLDLQPDILKSVVDHIQEEGEIVLKNGILFPHGSPETALSPLARQLLDRTQEAGLQGLELKKLRIQGAQKALRDLARSGLLVSLDGNIYFSNSVYQQLVHSIIANAHIGEELSIGQARDRSGLSRKYLIPLLNRMETDRMVKREGDLRRITRLP